jgi:GNAT superfamily N-acetyltransferase
VSTTYRVRPARLADLDVLVRHRISMFTDMGVPLDAEVLNRAFGAWLGDMMPREIYRAWVVDTAEGETVGGGGMTILPWPPGPRYLGDRLAFVYNLYTEPGHRRRGLGRLVMETMQSWCRDNGVSSMALNASQDGLPLYTSMGFAVTASPMMFLPIVRV